MRRVTGDNLAAFINKLPKNKDYTYIYTGNRSLIRIISVTNIRRGMGNTRMRI